LNRRVASVAVVLLGLIGGTTAVAGAANPKPNLSVVEISNPPATAKAGDEFAVEGKVRNAGKKAGKAMVKVSLRTSKRADVAAILFTDKVKVPPKSKKKFSGVAKIPRAPRPRRRATTSWWPASRSAVAAGRRNARPLRRG
jgi:hypothetical protein